MYLLSISHNLNSIVLIYGKVREICLSEALRFIRSSTDDSLSESADNASQEDSIKKRLL